MVSDETKAVISSSDQESTEVRADLTTATEGSADVAETRPESIAASDADSSEKPAKKGKAHSPRAKQHSPQRATLYRAFRAGRPVEGRIERVIKGGYEVRVGRSRGFCPHSQIDLHRVEEPEAFVGQTTLFRITQVRRGGTDVVLSRRALLEEERLEEAKAVRATLIEGSVMQGRVAGLADFGAFVDLGAGVMGLVHLSELSHSRISKVSEAVKPGDPVEVKILKLDDRRGRVSLSIKQAERDPWTDTSERFRVGEVYSGTVCRLSDFGAFVELAPGIEALAPASELPPSREPWREQLKPGEARDWLVLSVEPAQHRISLTVPVEGLKLDELPALEVGANLTGRVQRIERFGVFVWLGPGRVGLVPAMWSGVPKGQELERRFPIDEELEVEVVELSDDHRRIRLAKKGCGPDSRPAARPKPRESRQRPRAAEKSAPAVQEVASFGTSLADKLRAALGQPDGA
jgi:small subunit ribosomal protein S1